MIIDGYGEAVKKEEPITEDALLNEEGQIKSEEPDIKRYIKTEEPVKYERAASPLTSLPPRPVDATMDERPLVKRRSRSPALMKHDFSTEQPLPVSPASNYEDIKVKEERLSLSQSNFPTQSDFKSRDPPSQPRADDSKSEYYNPRSRDYQSPTRPRSDAPGGDFRPSHSSADYRPRDQDHPPPSQPRSDRTESRLREYDSRSSELSPGEYRSSDLEALPPSQPRSDAHREGYGHRDYEPPSTDQYRPPRDRDLPSQPRSDIARADRQRDYEQRPESFPSGYRPRDRDLPPPSQPRSDVYREDVRQREPESHSSSDRTRGLPPPSQPRSDAIRSDNKQYEYDSTPRQPRNANPSWPPPRGIRSGGGGPPPPQGSRGAAPYQRRPSRSPPRGPRSDYNQYNNAPSDTASPQLPVRPLGLPRAPSHMQAPIPDAPAETPPSLPPRHDVVLQTPLPVAPVLPALVLPKYEGPAFLKTNTQNQVC